jgi:hypothetical protein
MKQEDNFFIVIKVFDGDTLEVNPKWEWNNMNGKFVKITNQLKINDSFLFTRLVTLLTSKEVELKNPSKVIGEVIYCYVFLDGVNIANYFPELQPH